ncbi:hypothetical protein M23134_00616 [Microscilla marina ATCC 23134]|uniref:Uncharacterized protein n=1 Tax=Microscilla marina ATCC 23134 TaxID=313606 RepID=A1ZY98_MICM2|nr:hypothetical protein M23134_00616 [Microscilla marina ATCC 23134]
MYIFGLNRKKQGVKFTQVSQEKRIMALNNSLYCLPALFLPPTVILAFLNRLTHQQAPDDGFKVTFTAKQITGFSRYSTKNATRLQLIHLTIKNKYSPKICPTSTKISNLFTKEQFLF